MQARWAPAPRRLRSPAPDGPPALPGCCSLPGLGAEGGSPQTWGPPLRSPSSLFLFRWFSLLLLRLRPAPPASQPSTPPLPAPKPRPPRATPAEAGSPPARAACCSPPARAARALGQGRPRSASPTRLPAKRWRKRRPGTGRAARLLPQQQQEEEAAAAALRPGQPASRGRRRRRRRRGSRRRRRPPALLPLCPARPRAEGRGALFPQPPRVDLQQRRRREPEPGRAPPLPGEPGAER